MMMMKKHNNINTQNFNSLPMEALNSAPTSTSTTTTTSTSSPPPLAMNRVSKSISKPKPKIRIIHIFAPEIIKTDAANFRELVQRLTGKPSPPAAKKPKTTVKMTSSPPPAVKEEELSYFGGGGFLGGFPDLDGYFNIQELCELPFYPLNDPQYTMHNNAMDHEPQLIA